MPVYVFTVCNRIYFDFSASLVDSKEDPVISYPDSIALTAMKFFNAGGKWIMF